VTQATLCEQANQVECVSDFYLAVWATHGTEARKICSWSNSTREGTEASEMACQTKPTLCEQATMDECQSDTYLAIPATPGTEASKMCKWVEAKNIMGGLSYDEEEAMMMASISSATYCNDEKQILDWTCQACKDSKVSMKPGGTKLVVDAAQKNATRVVVSKLKDTNGCLLAFRGSATLESWIRDFSFLKHSVTEDFEGCERHHFRGCRVHGGFLKIWKNVKEGVLKALNDVGCVPYSSENHLYMTGHSLGAALANLAAFDLESSGFQIAKTYSFESPRIGNKAFADAFDEHFSSKIPVFRITHATDIIVHEPFRLLGYQHAGQEVWYEKNGDYRNANYRVCKHSEDSSCANQFSRHLPHPSDIHDHCYSPLVPSGHICFPVGCHPTGPIVV